MACRGVMTYRGDVSAAAALHETAPEYPAHSPERLSLVRQAKKALGRKPCASDLTQAKAIQRLAYDVVTSLRQDLQSASDSKSRMNVAVAIRSAIQAWDLARDAARIARNKPLPGSLRPESVPKRKKVQPSTFTEISPSGPVAQPSSNVLTASTQDSSKPPAS